MGAYSATFYLGSSYRCGNTPLPQAFLSDVMSSTNPICWFKYNIWHLAWCQQASFQAKFGFGFVDLVGLAAGDPIYDAVSYRGADFTKYPADPELGCVAITNPAICSEVATAWRTTETGDTESIPYVLKRANLWYVADLPFAYIGEEDRYLVFCDLLYDILGLTPPNTKRAIARIEDVDPNADPNQLRAIADYLNSQNIPFAVSVIPFYRDPFGYWSGGIPEENQLSWEPQVVSALKYMLQKGGKIILHGSTHQYDSLLNPYTGVTGDDYEFYLTELADDGFTVLLTGPVPDDSRRWATNRVKQGLAELKACGLTPIAWETPHYAASATDYQAFASLFPLTIQRALYFNLRVPASGFKGHGDPTYFGGQFFPYVIQKDLYGQKLAPENLGSYEPDPWYGYRTWLVEDILRCAQKNAVLRDSWASFYFHPFHDLAYLQQIVEGIQSLGYTFVPLSQDMQ